MEISPNEFHTAPEAGAQWENQCREAEKILAGHVVRDSVAGLEIDLDEDTARLLWGSEAFRADGMPYSVFLRDILLPTVHPDDRESCAVRIAAETLRSASAGGVSRLTSNYRERPGAQGRRWRTLELFFRVDEETRHRLCSMIVWQADEEKCRDLDRRRKLEERENNISRWARRLDESEAELEFVHVIAEYYQGIYAVNLIDDNTQIIKVPEYFKEALRRENGHVGGVLPWYGREMVDPEYLADFQRMTQYMYLRRVLESRNKVEMTFRKQNGQWIRLRVFRMPGYSHENPNTLWVFEDETATVSLRQKEEEARITANAAQAANQAKSQFLANMSHEIRTPLNAILGLSELGQREADMAAKDECFRDIRTSGRNLLENINSILDLSKIEAGKMEIQCENYQILDVVHDVITVLRIQAEEKKLDFYPQLDESIPRVLYGDDVNLSHIIMNLGANAIKYTQEGGSVNITVTWEAGDTPDSGELVVHVEDSGIGIRQEDMPYLYESYGRLDQKANRHIQGTGLGLPICQELVRLMDGRMGVESTYGVGSDFWVQIPQRVVDAAPCGALKEQKGNTWQSPMRYNTFTAPDAVVLVVDDQTVNLRVCRGLMSPYGMQVFTAGSGIEALQQMTQVWPDVVFMDHMMPGMDGVETVKRIRAMGERDPYFSVVPIIALTANAMKGVKDYFLQNGFNDFIPKPMELKQMDNALRTWLPGEKQEIIENEQEEAVLEIPADLASIPGVDAAQGIAYCGTVELYRKTLLMFRDQLARRCRRIAQSLEEGQREDYIIEVHGLKSAARWVGLAALGDHAEALEAAGKAGDTARLHADTPGLLEECSAAARAMAEL